MDDFINEKLISIFGNVLLSENNIDILSELIWSLLNITNYCTRKNGYDYLKEFINPTYMSIFCKIINLEYNEININLFEFLTNCVIESTDFAKFIFTNEVFMKLCLMKYIKPMESIKLQYDVKKSMSYFFISLSTISDIFNEKQKKTFFKIYEQLLEVRMFEVDIILSALKGLKIMFVKDQPEKKIVFNIIKNNNYELFDKLFFSLKEILEKYEDFDKEDIIIHNISIIIKHFISLSEQKDIIFLLQNTKLINFIEAFYNKIYFKSVKIELLEIIEILSQNTSNVVYNMIKDRKQLIGDIIKSTLNSKDFNIKMKGILIVFHMLSLNSVDINIILFQNGIIEHLISVNLLNEIEHKCLTNILNSIHLFINSIKPLENQWKVDIINNLKKIGITNGLECNTVRFTEENNVIINQIKNDINNILSFDKSTNNNAFDMMEEKKQIIF